MILLRHNPGCTHTNMAVANGTCGCRNKKVGDLIQSTALLTDLACLLDLPNKQEIMKVIQQHGGTILEFKTPCFCPKTKSAFSTALVTLPHKGTVVALISRTNDSYLVRTEQAAQMKNYLALNNIPPSDLLKLV